MDPERGIKPGDTLSAVRANILPLYKGFVERVNSLTQDPSVKFNRVDYYGIIREMPEYQAGIAKLNTMAEHMLNDDSLPLPKRGLIEEHLKRSPEKMQLYPIGAYLICHMIDSMKDGNTFRIAQKHLIDAKEYYKKEGHVYLETFINEMFRSKSDQMMKGRKRKDRAYRAIYNYVSTPGENDPWLIKHIDKPLGFILSGSELGISDMHNFIRQGLTWEDVRANIITAARQNLWVGGIDPIRDSILDGTMSASEANQLTRKANDQVTLGCIVIPKMKEMYEIVQDVHNAVVDQGLMPTTY